MFLIEIAQMRSKFLIFYHQWSPPNTKDAYIAALAEVINSIS